MKIMWKASLGVNAVLLFTVVSCAQVLGLEEATLEEENSGGRDGSGGTKAPGGAGGRGGSAGKGGTGTSNAGRAGSNGEAGTPNGPLIECGEVFNDGTCFDECATDTCCKEMDACFSDPECAGIFTCGASCEDDDGTCLQDCAAEHPDGVDGFLTATQCVSNCCDPPVADCTRATPRPARVEACTLLVSCDPTVPTDSISNCITLGNYPYLRCAAGASSCDDLKSCIGRREATDDCDPDDDGWYCDGTSALRCTEFGDYAIDCSRFGSRCSLFSATAGVEDARWPCALSPITTCTDAPAEFHCDGTKVYNCIDGKRYGFDCARFNQVCVETQDTAYCTERIMDCTTEPLGASCDGDVIKYCDATGRLGLYDCAPAGSTCATAGTQTGYCVAPGCTTEEVDACREYCDDDYVMRVCVGGVSHAIDCRDYGFERCHYYENHPITLQPWVACRNSPN